MRGERTRRGMRFVRESEFGTTPVLIPKRLVFFFYTTLNGRLSKRVPFTEPVNGVFQPTTDKPEIPFPLWCN